MTKTGQDTSILHVIAGGENGGAETFCLDAICALNDAGVRQHVICRPHHRYIETLTRRGVPFDTLAFNHMDRLWRGPSLIKRITRSFQPSVVHAWMGRAASFIPSSLSVPVVGWFGGYYDLKRYKNCDFYIGVTKDIVRYIGEESGRPEWAFLVHTFGTLEAAHPVNRHTLSTPRNAPVALLLSRMHHKKGIDTLLHTAKKLPGVYFWLAGDGPDIEQYQKLSKELNLTNVRFLGWRSDRAALLGSANVCVLPSRYEPFGTVMAEAWHIGVPLVAAKAAGPLAYVHDGQNGLLCEIDNPDDLADKIEMALVDNELRERLIENGHVTANALFSRKTTLDALLQTYAVISRRGKIIVGSSETLKMRENCKTI